MTLEHISKAWRAYKKNTWVIIKSLIVILAVTLGLMAIGMIPLLSIIPTFQGQTLGAQQMLQLFFAELGGLSIIFSGVLICAGILAGVILQAGFIKVCEKSLKGKANFNLLFATANKKWKSILGANFIILILQGILFSFMFGFLLQNVSFLIVSLLLMFVVSFFFLFINQAIVIDNCKAIASLKKSYKFVIKNFLSVIILFVIFFIISMVVSLIPILGSFISMLVVSPVMLLAFTSLYLERKRNLK